MDKKVIVLGAGMTGLGAGLSGFPIYEAAEHPGGICSSYYLRPGGGERLSAPPEDDDSYRFELGGGHWIFGGDPAVHRLIRSVAPVKSYTRRSSVWFPDLQLAVPYPVQNHLKYLGWEIATRCLREIIEVSSTRSTPRTMGDWLRASFGETLCNLFFGPFHHLYTAGLWEKIAPQDAYKSPVDLKSVIEGAFGSSPAAGYNTTFIYPAEGLNVLSQRLASTCRVHYGKRVVRIDVAAKEVHFVDGSSVPYHVLVSTLPLNRMIEMTELRISAAPDPSPSVLVLNIAAEKGPLCPEEHWVYVPSSKSGFHRVGFYSNVDVSFLPKRARKTGDRTSLYVESAHLENSKPSPTQAIAYSREAVKELQDWGWIGEVEAVDPTWIEVAYTWSWAGSRWKQEALTALEKHDIFQIGRYARWVFQGIADSLRDGLMVGGAMAGFSRCEDVRAATHPTRTVNLRP